MRWSNPRHRYVKKFALLPISIHGDQRWLETVYIKQYRVDDRYSDGFYYINERFITKEEYCKKKGEVVISMAMSYLRDEKND